MYSKISLFFMGICMSVSAFSMDYTLDKVEKRGEIFYVKETQEPLTGTLIRTYPTGRKWTESVFENGLLNGESRGFQKNGKPDHSIEFKNSLKNGLYKQYDSEGVLRIEGVYSDNKLNGISKIYYPSGKLQISETYKNGMLDGEWMEYYENGTPKTKAQFHQNQLDGLFQAFYADGKKQSEIPFKNGMRHGRISVFYPNGQLQYEMNFNQNEIDGENKRYDTEGHFLEQRVYQKGILVSGFSFENNQKIPFSQNQIDELNSKMILHTPQNTYKKEDVLYDKKTNKPVSGILRITRNNGSIQEEYEFLDGKPHGLSQLFDEQGHLTQQNVFNKGIKSGYRLIDKEGKIIKTCQIDDKGVETCNLPQP